MKCREISEDLVGHFEWYHLIAWSVRVINDHSYQAPSSLNWITGE